MFILGLLLMASGVDLHNTNQFDIPPEYQHETIVTIHTVDTQGEINFICGTQPKGYYTVACLNNGVIYIRNPCLDPEAKNYDSYAHKLCHEIGHTEGWNHVNQ